MNPSLPRGMVMALVAAAQHNPAAASFARLLDTPAPKDTRHLGELQRVRIYGSRGGGKQRRGRRS